jgi:hypothetical protein
MVFVNLAVDLGCMQAKSSYTLAVASTGGEYKTLLADYSVSHFSLDQVRKPLNLICKVQ